jgi:hypothetical protein
LNERQEAARAQFTADLVVNELLRAKQNHPRPFSSFHEGFAVILEEVDELKKEVWESKAGTDPSRMREEAIQVAAMAMRFIEELT